jgi:hypothetical protein
LHDMCVILGHWMQRQAASKVPFHFRKVARAIHKNLRTLEGNNRNAHMGPSEEELDQQGDDDSQAPGDGPSQGGGSSNPSTEQAHPDQGLSILSFPSTTTTGHRVMSNNATPAPVAAPKAPLTPPSVEEFCLWTFYCCWYIDKDWLVSFMASAQRLKPDSPIHWVEFLPKGHMHLVHCALKLVPPTKALPIAKIKEVMFSFILKTLNESTPCTNFFKACKATKPRKKTSKGKGKEKQPIGMAVDAPPPALPPALLGPSSEEQGTGSGSSSEEPDASAFPVTEAQRSAALLELLRDGPMFLAPGLAQAPPHAPLLAPSISSVLGKHAASSPPPLPTSPPPPDSAIGTLLIHRALQDWQAWMQH